MATASKKSTKKTAVKKKATPKAVKPVAKKSTAKASSSPDTKRVASKGKVLGRPLGSVYKPEGIALREHQVFGRVDQPQKVDGYRWVRLQVCTPEHAILLKQVAKLLVTEDPRLLSLAKRASGPATTTVKDVPTRNVKKKAKAAA